MKKQYSLCISNQGGFSLAEIMIALGLAGALSLVIMNNMRMQGKAQKTATINQNLLDLRRTLQDFLGRRDPCIASFTNVKPGEPILNLKFSESSTTYYAEVGKEFLKTGLKITEMHIMTPEEEYNYNKNSTNSGVVDFGSSNGDFIYTRKAILKVSVEKIAKYAGGDRTFYGGTQSFIYVPFIGAFEDQIHTKGEGIDKAQAFNSWQQAYNNEKNSLQTVLNAYTIPTEIKNGLQNILTYKSTSGNTYFPDPNNTADEKANDLPNKENGFYQLTVGGGWALVWAFGHYNAPMIECGNHVSLGIATK